MPDRETIVWRALSLGLAAASGIAAEWLITFVWELGVHQAPPKETADRRNPWPATLAWAAAIGVGAGVARAVANRSASAVWEIATNETPPGVPSS